MTVFLAELKLAIANPKFWALAVTLVGIAAGYAQGELTAWQAAQGAVVALGAYSMGVAVAERGVNKNMDVGYAIDDAASLAVKASEKVHVGLNMGEIKKDAAVKLATDYLSARGVNVAESVVAGAVESAVSDHFPKETPEVKA